MSVLYQWVNEVEYRVCGHKTAIAFQETRRNTFIIGTLHYCFTKSLNKSFLIISQKTQCHYIRRAVTKLRTLKTAQQLLVFIHTSKVKEPRTKRRLVQDRGE